MSLEKLWLDDAAYKSLKKPFVVIARFNPDRNPQAAIPQNPGVHFQVSIHPEKFSKSGRFIRMDGTKGDELHGWMRTDLLFIEEVLGELQEDGQTVSVIEEERAAA